MKKNALLISLVLIPLAGCSKIKTPGFDRYSNNVTFETFLEMFEEKKFDDYLDFKTSRKGKAYYGSEFSSSAKLGETSIYETSGTSETEISFGFDSDNNRSTLNEKSESSLSSTGAEADQQRVTKLTTALQYQFDAAQNSYVYIDTREKTYKKIEGENVTDTIVEVVDDQYTIFHSYLDTYKDLSDEDKTLFNFYIDGNVFTLAYTNSEKKEENAVDKEKIVMETTYGVQSVYQFEIKNGKLDFRSKVITSIQTIYFDQYTGHLKDEIDVSNDTSYSSLEITIGASTIKEIDTSNYSSLDKNPEGGVAA